MLMNCVMTILVLLTDQYHAMHSTLHTHNHFPDEFMENCKAFDLIFALSVFLLDMLKC